MNGWAILGLFVWTVAVAMVMFFVGVRHRDRVLRAAGLLKETAGSVVDTVKDAGKKL